MLTMSLFGVFSALMSFVLLFVSLILGARFLLLRNKNSPFECGFDPKDSGRLPFSMRFFLLGIVFLIFDIEVALLFPVILGLKMMFFEGCYLAGFIFLFILMGGLIHEWREGSLSWVV